MSRSRSALSPVLVAVMALSVLVVAPRPAQAVDEHVPVSPPAPPAASGIHNAADMRGGYQWWDSLIGSLMPGHAATAGPDGRDEVHLTTCNSDQYREDLLGVPHTACAATSS